VTAAAAVHVTERGRTTTVQSQALTDLHDMTRGGALSKPLILEPSHAEVVANTRAT
jgi:hypothetical protein